MVCLTQYFGLEVFSGPIAQLRRFDGCRKSESRLGFIERRDRLEQSRRTLGLVPGSGLYLKYCRGP